uniref:DOCKER domain-containing protein n=1 Tax=Meloidogyne floridensis TaxID=298350 RepID=A0A915PDT1_9BILA
MKGSTYMYLSDLEFLIVTVTPIPSPFYSELLLSPSRLTSWYYKYHKIQRFQLIRREFKTNTKWTDLEDNETMRPLPNLLNFAQIINEQELPPSHPIEVAIERVKEANDKLADLSSRVAEGFVSEFHMNLGGMIRGIVQADPFFTAQCRINCSEEENRCIENLISLIFEQITLLEYSLFIHSNNTPTTTTNFSSSNAASFHNSLVASFNSYKCQIETQFGKTSKSLLPEGASIYSKIDQNEIMGKLPTNVVSNNASNSSFLSPPSTINNSPTATRAFRSHSVSEFQILHLQIVEVEAKSKQKQQKNLAALNKRRNTSTTFSTKTDQNQTTSKSPQFLRLFSQKQNQKQQIPSTTFNLNTRISDCSLENFCFPMDTNSPPLPPRQSSFHSDVLICTKMKGGNI